MIFYEEFLIRFPEHPAIGFLTPRIFARAFQRILPQENLIKSDNQHFFVILQTAN